jgi:hypothetical protein
LKLAVGRHLLSNAAMALQGDVATFPLRDLLEMLARTRASGRLSVSRGMAARRFHLVQGRVMLASSSDEQTLLGRMLIERGLIDQQQLEQALAIRTQATSRGRSRPHPRLGKTLTEAGLISSEQLAGVLEEKIERMLIDTLAWPDGHFYFDDEAAPRRPAAVTSVVDLADLLGRAGSSRAPKQTGKQTSKQTRTETWVVADVDVIEVGSLTAPAESGPRRRKRRAAVA